VSKISSTKPAKGASAAKPASAPKKASKR
jgi:hypothetical protein